MELKKKTLEADYNELVRGGGPSAYYPRALATSGLFDE